MKINFAIVLLFMANFTLMASERIGKVSSITDININKETDFVFRHLDKFMKKNGLDPWLIPKQQFNFSHGYVELMNGSLTGLSSWVRSGDAYLHESSTTVTLPFLIKNITLQSDYNIHILIKNNFGSWEANVEDIYFNFDVLYNQAAKNISFNSIVIEKFGKFTPSVTGAFSSEITQEIHKIMKNHTYDQIVAAINSFIANYLIKWINQHLPYHL